MDHRFDDLLRGGFEIKSFKDLAADTQASIAERLDYADPGAKKNPMLIRFRHPLSGSEATPAQQVSGDVLFGACTVPVETFAEVLVRSGEVALDEPISGWLESRKAEQEVAAKSLPPIVMSVSSFTPDDAATIEAAWAAFEAHLRAGASAVTVYFRPTDDHYFLLEDLAEAAAKKP
jgi:hypothetical protein